MKKLMTAIFIITLSNVGLYGQALDKICPVLREKGVVSGGSSFILSAADLKVYSHEPTNYKSSIQIIDADKPWPPRWFTYNEYPSTSVAPIFLMVPINGEQQTGKFTFLTFLLPGYTDNQASLPAAYITCNAQWQPVDTFSPPGKELDAHEFKISKSGEKLYFLVEDTLVNAKDLFGKDTILTLTYEIIEIADARGKVVFHWNPLQQFGIKALFMPYRDVGRLFTTHNTFAWSHGNSLSFDYDGNILYSFKHIGIGKISRENGKIIWKVDRNQLCMNELSDTLPIFAQHDLRPAKDSVGNTFYTVLSNGDNDYPYCIAYHFSVKQSNTGKPVLKILKRVTPLREVSNSNMGNYGLEPDGRSVFSYGNFAGNYKAYRPLFEYRRNEELLGSYVIPYTNLSYRVHLLEGGRPPRPKIQLVNGWLVAADAAKSYTWYRLYDTDNLQVEEVGKGAKFKPLLPGSYCAVSKYGIGYSVSEPILVVQ